MDDNAILDLYFARDERGLTGAAAKYGGYCSAIAMNLLGKIQDAEECVNDTWLGSWRAIPPTRPLNLRVYLGRLCRNLALNRLRYSSAQKRGGGIALLEELEECLRMAAAAGACCVASYDAIGGLRTMEEMERKINNGWIQNELSSDEQLLLQKAGVTIL